MAETKKTSATKAASTKTETKSATTAKATATKTTAKSTTKTPAKAESAGKTTGKSKAPQKEVVVQEVTDTKLAPNDAVDEKADSKGTQRAKNYHISLREDGKWQVKLSKGDKALKLFNTQAEAIAFAKEKAKNQEGNITIHKVDGKIRKQRY